MGFLDFDPDGSPEIKIIRNSIINDNKSPPPALFAEETAAERKTGSIEFNKSKFIRKEDFGACVLDKTGIYVVNKNGLRLLEEIRENGFTRLKGKLRRNKRFVSRLIQYNILVTRNEDS
jgi:hypothetical protein